MRSDRILRTQHFGRTSRPARWLTRAHTHALSPRVSSELYLSIFHKLRGQGMISRDRSIQVLCVRACLRPPARSLTWFGVRGCVKGKQTAGIIVSRVD